MVTRSSAYVRYPAGGPAQVSASLRLNGGSRICCHLYPPGPPILAVDDAHVSVSVTVPDPDKVTTEDVDAARLLASEAARYVTELSALAEAARPHPAEDAA